jgi:hypothetical protein
MANGRLAVSSPDANTETQLYQAPSSLTSSISISACNTNGSAAKIRISLDSSTAVGIATTNCIEYNSSVPASTTLERGGIVVANQQKIFCYSDIGGVNFVVYGYES